MRMATAARGALLEGARLYPLCPKPHLALGSLLRAARRPRAALRRFERALALTPDAHDDDAYLAAVNAGSCAVQLATAHPARAAALLPHAQRRLAGALVAAPADSRDRPMIEQLLNEAHRLLEETVPRTATA